MKSTINFILLAAAVLTIGYYQQPRQTPEPVVQVITATPVPDDPPATLPPATPQPTRWQPPTPTPAPATPATPVPRATPYVPKGTSLDKGGFDKRSGVAKPPVFYDPAKGTKKRN